MSKTGVLLVNLGSPDSTSIVDVRSYLREFLMDERVLDIPYAARFCLVNFVILPFRPRKTSEAYRKIWRPEGSPLVVTSRKVTEAMKKRMEAPVALAMRYKNPSIASGIGELYAQGVREIALVPLYPHYAMSSCETVVERVREVLADGYRDCVLKVLPPFYNDPDYIAALVESARPYLAKEYDHLLFSFHGVPERHLRKSDSSGTHCLATPDCCEGANPAHATCYRAQVRATLRAFVQKAAIPEGKYSLAFQSRLGRDPWLKPYTSEMLLQMPRQGIRRLLVICPAFVSDCLETLEEIGLRGRESFIAAGGSDLTLIPCLNEHPAWLDTLEKLTRRLLSQTPPL
jgi:ferrochelatase